MKIPIENATEASKCSDCECHIDPGVLKYRINSQRDVCQWCGLLYSISDVHAKAARESVIWGRRVQHDRRQF